VRRAGAQAVQPSVGTLVLLELATWRHLYSTATVRPADLEEALTEKVKGKVLDAAITAMEADLPDHAEDCTLQRGIERDETGRDGTERGNEPV
jgi:hypothetical protein